MKPLHLAVCAATLIVAAVILLIANEPRRHAEERSAAREAAARRDGASHPGGPAEVATADTAAAPHALERGFADDGPVAITLAIVDPDDAPASGADVLLDRGIDALRAQADTMGVLRLQDFAPGSYLLRARHGTLGGALRFEAKGTRDLGTLRLTATVSVRGHVYGAEGEPLPNALVEARRAATHESLPVGPYFLRPPEPEGTVDRAATRDDGAFELVVLTGGTYALRATARGYPASNRDGAIFDVDAVGIDFHMKEGALVEGRVLDRKQGVGGARVLASDPNQAPHGRPATAETVTRDDGGFSLILEPGAQCMLTVLAAGYAVSQQAVTPPQADIQILVGEGASLRLVAVDADRPSVPAARVSVVAAYQTGSMAGETDERGRLTLENLPTLEGVLDVKLCVWGGGYATTTIDVRSAQAHDGLVDLGVVRLARGGIVTGRVFDRATGGPIGGARVGAFGGYDRDLRSIHMASSVSAQDGSFRIEGVPLDAHTVTATHEGFVSDADLAFLGGGSGGRTLFRDARREVLCDVGLLPAASIHGLVVAPDGSPVAGAVVRALHDDLTTIARLLGGKPREATTDAKGAFVLTGFRPLQSTTLLARHPDFRESGGVDVVAGTGDSATLQLVEPRTITGVVVAAGGAPVRGVVVDASGRTAFTDENGAYVLRNVAERVRVTFDHPDYQPPDPVGATVDTWLDLGRTVLFPGGSISGMVVRDDESRAPGVVVLATKEPGNGAPHTRARAVSDAKGLFEIRGLVEGMYTLRTNQRGTWSAEVKTTTGARDARIVLVPAGRLPGRITTRSGAPVPGASVRAERGGGALLGWARSAADGTFEIASLPSDTTFDVVIEHEAFRSLRVGRVEVSGRTREFVMEPGGTVAGQVVDQSGEPVANAEVEVRVAGHDAGSVRTDARGEFTARGLDDGPISVRLGPANLGLVATDWVEVVAGVRDVRIIAVEGGSISGKVRDAAGAPASQVTVRAVDAQQRVVASAWVSGADGAFELRGLPEGMHTLLALRATRRGPQIVGLVPGVAAGAADVEIRLRQ